MAKKIMLVGSFCQLDVLYADFLLATSDFEIVVIRNIEDQYDVDQLWIPPQRFNPQNNLLYVKNSREFRQIIRGADLVISISMGILNLLAKWWPLAPWILPTPLVLIGVGADFSESIRRKYRRTSWVFLKLIRISSLIHVPAYPEILTTLELIGNKVKTSFVRYPVQISKYANAFNREGKLHILHPSNLDWGLIDNSPLRNSTKGNDRFLKALINMAKNGNQFHCTILSRGPDREVAKKMIRDAGIEKHFTWKNQVTPLELENLILDADLVVDQFDIGGFGLLSLQSMSLSTPVMIYLNPSFLQETYPLDQIPPVFNCQTAAEIEEFLISLDRKTCKKRGEDSRIWLESNHGKKMQSLAIDLANIIAHTRIELERIEAVASIRS